MEAQVWMTGRVGSEVEYRAESGSPWATFRMACTPRTVRGGEWGDEQTTWVSVSCGNKLAQNAMYSLRKGDPVIVVGKLRTNRWHDANGIEHEQLRIRATSVGHDLTAGTSSFYRTRRDTPAEDAEAQPTSEGTTSADAAEDYEHPNEVIEPGSGDNSEDTAAEEDAAA